MRRDPRNDQAATVSEDEALNRLDLCLRLPVWAVTSSGVTVPGWQRR